MKIFSTSILVLGISVGFLSCQKDSAPPAPTKTDNISSSAWVHESSGVDFDKNGTIDISLAVVGVQACRLDNVLTFKKDNTATSDEGATKCNAADAQSTQFKWSFADNESSLIISDNVFSAINGKLKIQTLTNTNFSLSKDTVVSSQNVSIILNLKH